MSLLVMVVTGCTSRWQAPMTGYGDTPSPRQSAQRNNQPAATSSPIRSNYYRVRRGDTLYSIAWRTGFDYRQLARWNRLSPPYTIYVGQLVLTKPPPSVTKPSTKSSSTRPSSGKAAAKPPVTAKSSATKPDKTTTTKPQASRNAAAEKFKPNLRWRWPTSGKVIKGFRAGDDTRKGIVIAGRLGQKVFAAEQGKIVYSGSGLIGYGKLIIIKHNNNYLSAYGHNRKILVKEGDWVTKGQQIAEMGNNDQGDSVLHFEIRKQGRPVNPTNVLPRR